MYCTRALKEIICFYEKSHAYNLIQKVGLYRIAYITVCTVAYMSQWMGTYVYAVLVPMVCLQLIQEYILPNSSKNVAIGHYVLYMYMTVYLCV